MDEKPTASTKARAPAALARRPAARDETRAPAAPAAPPGNHDARIGADERARVLGIVLLPPAVRRRDALRRHHNGARAAARRARRRRALEVARARRPVRLIGPSRAPRPLGGEPARGGDRGACRAPRSWPWQMSGQPRLDGRAGGAGARPRAGQRDRSAGVVQRQQRSQRADGHARRRRRRRRPRASGQRLTGARAYPSSVEPALDPVEIQNGARPRPRRRRRRRRRRPDPPAPPDNRHLEHRRQRHQGHPGVAGQPVLPLAPAPPREANATRSHSRSTVPTTSQGRSRRRSTPRASSRPGPTSRRSTPAPARGRRGRARSAPLRTAPLVDGVAVRVACGNAAWRSHAVAVAKYSQWPAPGGSRNP